MQTGQFLRLNRDTPAIDTSGDKPTAITVPAGAVICTTGKRNPENPKMIAAQWEDCRLFMFEIDVQERGEKITEAAEPPRVKRAGGP